MCGMSESRTYTAFAGDVRIARGDLRALLPVVKDRTERAPHDAILIFDDESGRPVDFDLRGSVDEVLEREAPRPERRRGPGRPRLGVVSREISLLPRHWAWLATQRGGASATLRRLVEEARRNEGPRERARRVAAAAGNVMTALAGDRANFEEAYRALDAGDRDRFEELVSAWPADVREHLLDVAADALDTPGESGAPRRARG